MMHIFLLFLAAAPPSTWESRGTGGGGALFAPAYNPHAVNELYVACDMGELFRSTSGGQAWQPIDFREIQGNRLTSVQWTSNPSLAYTLENDQVSGGYFPSRTQDGGLTWSPLALDPTGADAWGILVDSGSPSRLLLASYDTVYASTDAGASFSNVYANSGGGLGVYLAGALFDGAEAFIGTNRGLLVTNGWASFTLMATPGIPAGETIASFAGAREGATRRLAAVTITGSSYPGIAGDSFGDYASIYTLDIGAGSWVPRTSGISGGMPFWIGMAANDVDTLYAAGGGGGSGFDPVVFRSANGGVTWSQSLMTVGNANVDTGWCGDQGDRTWGYAELAFGFAVSPVDSQRAAFSDFGFVHTTTNGGTTWQQAYVDPADANPAGQLTPRGLAYRSSGLENTSSYYLAWDDVDTMFAGFCDIRGLRSTDGGVSWGQGYTGHSENSMYQIVRHPQTGTLYAATSTIHDIYQSTRLQDATLDAGDGRVIASVDGGATWTLVHDFAHPVICLALDPNQSDRLYASVIHSTQGDVFVTNNLSAGIGSSWTRLGTPPRTQGHPFNIHVLDDGTLVSTYSGRRPPGGTPTFTNSSGVFVSTDSGTSWLDRSHQDMIYWTKDLTIDPHDPTQSRWYVGVFGGWGSGPGGQPAPGGMRGLYRTSDRGVSWTRILVADRVTSCTLSPLDADEAYVTTEIEGLFHTSNMQAAGPTFSSVASYPFRQPERVFYNPFDPTEIWVTSFGNGLRVGSIGIISTCGDCNGDMVSSILDALQAAQHAAGIIALGDPAFGRCNVNGTLGGSLTPGAGVDILDALAIARFAAQIIPSLSCMP